MCLIFFVFILTVSLSERKKGFFGKKTDMEWGPHGFFFVKDPKMEGTTVKNSKNEREERWFLL